MVNPKQFTEFTVNPVTFLINARIISMMNYSIFSDVFTGLYHTTLLGGEFANCHGQGSTPESAVVSLKIRVNQLRGKRNLLN